MMFCTFLPNLEQESQTLSLINVKMASVSHLGFLKREIPTAIMGSDWQSASLCNIMVQNVEELHYGICQFIFKSQPSCILTYPCDRVVRALGHHVQ